MEERGRVGAERKNTNKFIFWCLLLGIPDQGVIHDLFYPDFLWGPIFNTATLEGSTYFSPPGSRNLSGGGKSFPAMEAAIDIFQFSVLNAQLVNH